MNPRPQPPDASRLVAQAVAGDLAARRILVERHGPLVLALCRRLASEPDDAFQDIWLRIFANLHRYDQQRPARLRPWIATLAHRHLIDMHRRLRRRGAVVPFEDHVASRHPASDDILAARDHRRRLHGAIGRLPRDQQRAVVMHHLAGLSLRDIAREEGVTVNTVKSRLHRGRARLTEILGGGG